MKISYPHFILTKATTSDVVAFVTNCPREESNPYYKIRNLVSYPLNDEGIYFLTRAEFLKSKSNSPRNFISEKFGMLFFRKKLFHNLPDFFWFFVIYRNADIRVEHCFGFERELRRI